MSYFPLCIELAQKPCLVVGGGKVAARKLITLLTYGAKVKVKAPDVCEEILSYEQAIQLERGDFKETDVKEQFLVIAATNKQQVNRQVATTCKKQGILVNVADQPDISTFIFPATIKRGDLVIGITTSGKSPIIAKQVKRDIEEKVDLEYDNLLNALGEVRPLLKQKIIGDKLRAKVLYELAKEGIKNHGMIEPHLIEKVMSEYETGD